MIEIELCIRQPREPGAPAVSPRAIEIRRLFGLPCAAGADASKPSKRDRDRALRMLVPPTVIPVPMPGIVFITGPSGGGKSTMLAALAEQCALRGINVIQLDESSDLPERPLIDAVGDGVDQAASLLALAGLSDAHLMMRTPSQLSDGERWRLRLAIAMDRARRTSGPAAIVADEFAAPLDRTTALALARGVRRRIDSETRRAGRFDPTRSAHDLLDRPQSAPTLICATSHDDLLEALRPDVLVWKGLGDEVEVLTR